jgi:hypothetical protein
VNGVRKRWIAAWGGAVAIAIVNGAAREGVYVRRLGDERANRVSVLTGIGAFSLYFAALQRRWPLPTRRDALSVGAVWTAMTVVFEFGFGRLRGESWEEMLGAYDLRRGELWPLVLAWIALGPEVTRRLTRTTVLPVEERREDARALVQ